MLPKKLIVLFLIIYGNLHAMFNRNFVRTAFKNHATPKYTQPKRHNPELNHPLIAIGTAVAIAGTTYVLTQNSAQNEEYRERQVLWDSTVQAAKHASLMRKNDLTRGRQNETTRDHVCGTFLLAIENDRVDTILKLLANSDYVQHIDDITAIIAIHMAHQHNNEEMLDVLKRNKRIETLVERALLKTRADIPLEVSNPNSYKKLDQ